MCTVSFLPREHGYLLGMNRDEKIARGAGYPPEVRQLQGKRAAFPSDKAGGTWIACNEYGISLALLNWNVPVMQPSPQLSRGLIIPHLLSSMNPSELNSALATYAFVHCAPFRLLAVIPDERRVLQWSWDGTHLAERSCSWEMRHWFSSSASDSRAQELRGHVCSRASNDRKTGSVAWLRQIHQSHENGPGAFSMCVHRELVETLSYTEISCTQDRVSMVHAIGKPCDPRETRIIELWRVRSSISIAIPSLMDSQPSEQSDVCRS